MPATTTPTAYRAEFTYRNSYGSTRTALSFVLATSRTGAERAARARLVELYGITRARLVSLTLAPEHTASLLADEETDRPAPADSGDVVEDQDDDRPAALSGWQGTPDDPETGEPRDRGPAPEGFDVFAHWSAVHDGINVEVDAPDGLPLTVHVNDWRVVNVITGTTTPADPDGTEPTAAPQVAPDLAERARELLARYGRTVARWQLANLRTFDAPGVADAEHYSEALEELAHELADLAADLVPDYAQPVTVAVSNFYACGRESSSVHELPAPPIGADLADEDDADAVDWWEETVHEHTGDGHPCGSSEHATYTALVTGAPGRVELVGLSREWEG